MQKIVTDIERTETTIPVKEQVFLIHDKLQNN